MLPDADGDPPRLGEATAQGYLLQWPFMPVTRQLVDSTKFNAKAVYPCGLRELDFKAAMQDVYDFFYDINSFFVEKRLPRLEEVLRGAILSGVVSDMLTASLGKHARNLVRNRYHNGHPDLIVGGHYPENAVKAGSEGVEIKATRKRGGAVDTHGARKQWMCVFVYEVDEVTEPAYDRRPLRFREVYLTEVVPDDFRRNPRGELGTRTATLDRRGIAKLRRGWIYLDR